MPCKPECLCMRGEVPQSQRQVGKCLKNIIKYRWRAKLTRCVQKTLFIIKILRREQLLLTNFINVISWNNWKHYKSHKAAAATASNAFQIKFTNVTAVAPLRLWDIIYNVLVDAKLMYIHIMVLFNWKQVGQAVALLPKRGQFKSQLFSSFMKMESRFW